MDWFDILTTFILNYFSVSLILFIFWCIRETVQKDWERQLEGITFKNFVFGLIRSLVILPIVSVQILWRYL